MAEDSVHLHPSMRALRPPANQLGQEVAALASGPASALRMRLRGGMPEMFPWERPYQTNAERWAEAGVSLQPDFGPDANLDVPMEQVVECKTVCSHVPER
jgi:hypothetical protein